MVVIIEMEMNLNHNGLSMNCGPKSLEIPFACVQAELWEGEGQPSIQWLHSLRLTSYLFLKEESIPQPSCAIWRKLRLVTLKKKKANKACKQLGLFLKWLLNLESQLKVLMNSLYTSSARCESSTALDVSLPHQVKNRASMLACLSLRKTSVHPDVWVCRVTAFNTL